MGALIAILALVFVTGLCIGSFLNVVILRTLSEESIVFPASKCPKCQTPLKWWHNIPVLSYIFLRGKCAFCKEHISIQYPIIELLTGIIFTLLFMKFGVSVDTLFAWIVSAILIVIAGTDIKEKVVYEKKKFYIIMLVTKKYIKENKLSLKYGKSNNKDYFLYLLKKEQNVLSRIPKKRIFKRWQYLIHIYELKKIIKRI